MKASVLTTVTRPQLRMLYRVLATGRAGLDLLPQHSEQLTLHWLRRAGWLHQPEGEAGPWVFTPTALRYVVPHLQAERPAALKRRSTPMYTESLGAGASP